MITIGLTGGIGSGKSFVAERFAANGIPCYNC
ncbi:MAG: dephospho-CoA kinase, partial [Salinivirgaceae bacterium]|nr:dephospho-CoA kinase [Salinivirgaceae bacterium]